MLVIERAYPKGSEVGITRLASGTTVSDALLLEVVMTFVLVLVILSVAIGRTDAAPVVGLMIGGVVAASILTIGPLTGSSLNPALSFGPQFVLGEWMDAWVFWVAPPVGALLGALAFGYVFGGERRAAALRR